jgi:hypothetical protein
MYIINIEKLFTSIYYYFIKESLPNILIEYISNKNNNAKFKSQLKAKINMMGRD